jgi:DNA-binding NarL/FixJ family response regulator
MAAQLFVVENYPVIRHGLTAAVAGEDDLAICGETGSITEARSRIPEANPDITLVNIFLKDGTGLRLIKDLQEEAQDLKVLVFSGQDEFLYARRALTAGANGYLSKEKDMETVLRATREVLDGGVYLSRKMTSVVLSERIRGQAAKQSPLEGLTNRELEVFSMIGQGLGRQEISEALSLSPKTIDTYRDHLKDKLSLDTNAKLRRHAAVWMATNELPE